MPDSRAALIIAAFAERARAIRLDNGFQTDLGETLLINELPQFGPDDPRQVLVLLVGDDEISAAVKGFFLRIPLTLLVLVDADVDDGWTQVERGIADVKRAIELEDRTLGGLLTSYLERGNVERIPREAGSMAIAAAVPYIAPMKEGWGTP